MPAAGFDPALVANVNQKRLRSHLHAVLHEEGCHAGSGSAVPVRRRAIQGVNSESIDTNILQMSKVTVTNNDNALSQMFASISEQIMGTNVFT